MKKVNYQIQVNTLVSLTPEQKQTLSYKLTQAMELALFEIDKLDGIYVSIEQEDLLHTPENIPAHINEILERFAEKEMDYETCGVLTNELKHAGYSIEYGLYQSRLTS